MAPPLAAGTKRQLDVHPSPPTAKKADTKVASTVYSILVKKMLSSSEGIFLENTLEEVLGYLQKKEVRRFACALVQKGDTSLPTVKKLAVDARKHSIMQSFTRLERVIHSDIFEVPEVSAARDMLADELRTTRRSWAGSNFEKFQECADALKKEADHLLPYFTRLSAPLLTKLLSLHLDRHVNKALSFAHILRKLKQKEEEWILTPEREGAEKRYSTCIRDVLQRVAETSTSGELLFEVIHSIRDEQYKNWAIRHYISDVFSLTLSTELPGVLKELYTRENKNPLLLSLLCAANEPQHADASYMYAKEVIKLPQAEIRDAHLKALKKSIHLLVKSGRIDDAFSLLAIEEFGLDDNIHEKYNFPHLVYSLAKYGYHDIAHDSIMRRDVISVDIARCYVEGLSSTKKYDEALEFATYYQAEYPDIDPIEIVPLFSIIIEATILQNDLGDTLRIIQSDQVTEIADEVMHEVILEEDESSKLTIFQSSELIEAICQRMHNIDAKASFWKRILNTEHPLSIEVVEGAHAFFDTFKGAKSEHFYLLTFHYARHNFFDRLSECIMIASRDYRFEAITSRTLAMEGLAKGSFPEFDSVIRILLTLEKVDDRIQAFREFLALFRDRGDIGCMALIEQILCRLPELNHPSLWSKFNDILSNQIKRASPYELNRFLYRYNPTLVNKRGILNQLLEENKFDTALIFINKCYDPTSEEALHMYTHIFTQAQGRRGINELKLISHLPSDEIKEAVSRCIFIDV